MHISSLSLRYSFFVHVIEQVLQFMLRKPIPATFSPRRGILVEFWRKDGIPEVVAHKNKVGGTNKKSCYSQDTTVSLDPLWGVGTVSLWVRQ